jgi:hypothetical protein
VTPKAETGTLHGNKDSKPSVKSLYVNPLLISGLAANSTSFTVFPKLPAELQHQIWVQALPTDTDVNGRRILNVAYRWLTHDDDSWEDRFEVNKRKRSVFVTHPGILDIGMSRACRESRTLWLKTFTTELPVRKGVVRYDNETTIYPTDSHSLRFRFDNTPTIFKPVPKFVLDIKRLALRQGDVQLFWAPLSGDGLSFLQDFRNLETLVAVVEVKWSRGNWDNNHNNRSELQNLSQASSCASLRSIHIARLPKWPFGRDFS